MKIIFLDIDGVLTSQRLHSAFNDTGTWHRFDPVAIAFLNRLCKEFSDVKVVICSTWRKTHERDTFSDLLRGAGFQGHLHADWRTPDYWASASWSDTGATDHPRGREVKAWMDAHEGEVDTYVILDDGRDFFDWQPNTVCHYHDGMMYQNFTEACDLLAGTDPRGIAQELKP